MIKVGLINAIPKHDLAPSHIYAQTLSIPLGLLYIATYLKENIPDIEVIIRDTWQDVLEESPNLVGIYSVTQNFNHAKEIAHHAKEAGSITMVGGGHMTALPHRLPQEFDFGVIGEGEKTVFEVVMKLHQGASTTDSVWQSIDGLSYHTPDGNVLTSGRRPEEKNLDVFPFPRREFWVQKLGIAHMITSRGCPFSCSFCSEPALWEKYRTHSPEHVIREIEDILTHFHSPHILMADDIFTVDIKRMRRLAELIEERGLQKQVAFSCWGRAQLINEEMVSLLKKMNFVYIAFGIESASPKVLAGLKRGATIEAAQRAIDLCHAAGLKVGCTFIIASPEETVEDLQMTHDFIRKNQKKMAGVEINPAIPLPGTPLWVNALQRGLVSEEMDWSRLRDYSVFEDFDPEQYVVLNERFFEPHYQDMFRRMHDLYREIVDRGEIAELTLEYLNPAMERASFKQ